MNHGRNLVEIVARGILGVDLENVDANVGYHPRRKNV